MNIHTSRRTKKLIYLPFSLLQKSIWCDRALPVFNILFNFRVILSSTRLRLSLSPPSPPPSPSSYFFCFLFFLFILHLKRSHLFCLWDSFSSVRPHFIFSSTAAAFLSLCVWCVVLLWATISVTRLVLCMWVLSHSLLPLHQRASLLHKQNSFIEWEMCMCLYLCELSDGIASAPSSSSSSSLSSFLSLFRISPSSLFCSRNKIHITFFSVSFSLSRNVCGGYLYMFLGASFRSS